MKTNESIDCTEIDYKKLCERFEKYINKTQSRFKKCVDVINKKDDIDQFDKDMKISFTCYDVTHRLWYRFKKEAENGNK